ncbi:putative sterigmatocystin biosynthesis P450 monooxygenase [Lachnellula cervina]|uniref:Putative sterigmatocystin biosynthesis P450 monooxygenase n=1 Tax=Lachnellula cervina TaxID=1316786 RepID=A0A7D8UNC8_9HELO|nr:putative sterigmatocystin biosynthesis P450 monooxygenase [Lachnellula cervina]
MSRGPGELSNVRGRILKDIARLHEKYGEVVRVGPDAVIFNNPDAWADMYAHKPGKGVFPKDPLRHTRELWIHGAPDVFTAEDTDHPRLRRLINPAFSSKALREQEPLIQGNVNLLITRLQEQMDSDATAVVDMNEWINWTTFDLIGDLAFGETFDCLKTGGYHPWVALICSSIKTVSILGSIKQWPWIEAVWQFLIGGIMIRAMRQFHKLVIEKVDRRLSRTKGRNDFLQSILDHKDTEKSMTQDELYSNAALLVMAGTETSATTLAGTIYHLARNQQVLLPLQEELRATFKSEDEMTFKTVSDIPNLLAALHESMRMYPSVAVTNPRRVPKGGASVIGKWLPENTTVGTYQWVVYNSSTNFRDPGIFDPSRWQGNPYYANDRREIFKPFSVGPKSCVGKQLAYAEMQLILVKLLWKFDLTLADEKNVWTDQKVHWSWMRVPLMIKLKERNRHPQK